MARKDEMTPSGHILIVDDQENMCWVLSKLLADRGHLVRTAQSGARALKALDGFECQVAVVDYRLPDADGLSLIAKMRSRLGDLRAILMSSYGSAALRNQASEEHLFAYLDKPFNNDLMLETIEAGIRAHDAGQAPAATTTLFPRRATT